MTQNQSLSGVGEKPVGYQYKHFDRETGKLLDQEPEKELKNE